MAYRIVLTARHAVTGEPIEQVIMANAPDAENARGGAKQILTTVGNIGMLGEDPENPNRFTLVPPAQLLDLAVEVSSIDIVQAAPPVAKGKLSLV
jgi:hypothetical protein